MIRKQIYLKERQQEVVRSLAKTRGVSEAEIIREAIEGQRGQQAHGHLLDALAWKRALKLMRSLQPRKAAPNKNLSRVWNRPELYEDRLNKYGRGTG